MTDEQLISISNPKEKEKVKLELYDKKAEALALKKKRNAHIVLPRVEEGNEIYMKVLKNIDINTFKETIRNVGMNPFRNIDHISLNKSVESLVLEKEKQVTDFDIGSVYHYIAISPKEVNTFNSAVDLTIDLDSPKRRQRTKLKKDYEGENNVYKRAKKKTSFVDFDSSLRSDFKQKEDIKMGQEIKKKIKKQKIRDKSQKKVKIDNHVN